MSSKLFLEFNNIGGKFHVLDEKGNHKGDGYEPTDAIKHARTVTKDPIYLGETCDLPTYCVSERPDNATADAEIFISELAEISGMKVKRLFDDDMHFIGYTMELI